MPTSVLPLLTSIFYTRTATRGVAAFRGVRGPTLTGPRSRFWKLSLGRGVSDPMRDIARNRSLAACASVCQSGVYAPHALPVTSVLLFRAAPRGTPMKRSSRFLNIDSPPVVRCCTLVSFGVYSVQMGESFMISRNCARFTLVAKPALIFCRCDAGASGSRQLCLYLDSAAQLRMSFLYVPGPGALFRAALKCARQKSGYHLEKYVGMDMQEGIVSVRSMRD